MTSDFEGISIPDFIYYIYYPILILEKEPVFPFLLLSAKQGNYLIPFLLRLWYEAVIDWGLNPGPPALEASIISLVYRGGGCVTIDLHSFCTRIQHWLLVLEMIHTTLIWSMDKLSYKSQKVIIHIPNGQQSSACLFLFYYWPSHIFIYRS